MTLERVLKEFNSMTDLNLKEQKIQSWLKEIRQFKQREQMDSTSLALDKFIAEAEEYSTHQPVPTKKR